MAKLLELVEAINAEIDGSCDLRLEAAIKLAKARDLVRKKDSEANGKKWKEFATQHFNLSWSEVKKLVSIGSSKDPKAAMKVRREKDRMSAVKFRKSKKENGSDVRAQASVGAAGGGDSSKPSGEKADPEVGTVDLIIHAYEAADDEAHDLFHEWLRLNYGYEVVSRHPSVKPGAMPGPPAQAMRETA